jgi:alpha-1,2-glucosyltransferase
MVFLVWNGGIVLGDKSNHMAGLHFPQLFYFTGFLSFFSLPWTFSEIMSFLFQSSIKR